MSSRRRSFDCQAPVDHLRSGASSHLGASVGCKWACRWWCDGKVGILSPGQAIELDVLVVDQFVAVDFGKGEAIDALVLTVAGSVE